MELGAGVSEEERVGGGVELGLGLVGLSPVPGIACARARDERLRIIRACGYRILAAILATHFSDPSSYVQFPDAAKNHE